jgi:small-conductance mechanosensitive channel
MNALIEKINTSLLDLVGKGIEILPAIAAAVIILLLTRFGANLIQRFTITVGERTIRSEALRSLLKQTSYVATWVVGVLVASTIAFPDLRLGDIIGLLGLGSVAIGFAFQDIFKNFLAGVLLLLREPFRLHDQIIVKDFEGTVEEINIRTTKIRTYQGEQVLVPNSLVFTSPVQVLTAFPHRRTDLAVGVDYHTSLPQTVDLLLATLSDVEGVLPKPAPEIDVVAFGDSSINLVVRYWTRPQKVYVRRIQTRVMIAIKQAFDQADINIPYPIRTLYFFDQKQHNDYFPASISKDAH